MCGIFKKLLDEHHKPNQANSDHLMRRKKALKMKTPILSGWAIG